MEPADLNIVEKARSATVGDDRGNEMTLAGGAPRVGGLGIELRLESPPAMQRTLFDERIPSALMELTMTESAKEPAPAHRASGTWTLRRLGEHEGRIALAILGVVLVLVCLINLQRHALQLARWDWMLISGLIALGLGIVFAEPVPTRLRGMLTRLAHRGTLVASPDSIYDAAQSRARSWSLWGGAVASLALFCAFVLAYGIRMALTLQLPLTIIAVALGFVAGRYLGRMAAYGWLGWTLERLGSSLRLQPGHYDGAAGLRPIGDFYLYQATLAAIPAAHLAIWWFIIPWLPGNPYGHWRDPYLALLPVAIAFEALAFLVPMWAFHRIMTTEKCEWLKEADALSRQIEAEREKLSRASDTDHETIKARRAALVERCTSIEDLPTWPLNITLWRAFIGRTTALAAPLFVELLNLDGIENAGGDGPVARARLVELTSWPERRRGRGGRDRIRDATACAAGPAP